MARKRWKSDARPGELNLTAMIDVAFQLLNFFIITVKPVDVLAHLQAFRPSPEKVNTNQPSAPMIRIMVLPGFYVMNDVQVSMSELDRRLRSLAASDATQTILVMCANKSSHAQLVELLDKCVKWKLTNVSVVSSAGI
jgi:biopolymer transport protein ExbD